jgi:hypothetical protein
MRAPAPFSIESRRREAGFDKGFERFTKRVCQRFPELKWHVFEPSGFEDSDFVDDHHLSEKGGLLLIAKLAEKLESLNSSSSDVPHVSR